MTRAEVRATLSAALARDGLALENGKLKGVSQVNQLFMLFDACSGERELFRDRRADAYVTLTIDGRRETLKLRSRRFKSFLRRLYMTADVGTGLTVSANSLDEAVESIVAATEFNGNAHDVNVRVGHCDGCIYLDLGDDTWCAVEIDRHGWRVVDDPPVKFHRPASLLPVAAPEQPQPSTPKRRKDKGRPREGLERLRDLVNVRDEHWPLIVAFLVGYFCGGPYPVLQLFAEAGSAKTCALSFIRALVDPATPMHRTPPKDERDMAIAASNGLVFAVDNVSRVEPWLSDAFCRLATGGGFGTRKNYTDDEEQLFNVRRPSIIASINEVATRGDLLSRSLVVPLPRIEAYKSEKVLWAYFDQVRPLLLGALLDAVVFALAHPVEPGSVKSRLADFCEFALAAADAPGTGTDRKAMLDAFRSNLAVATDTTLEACPVVEPLFKLMNTIPPSADGARVWSGTMRVLLEAITPKLSEPYEERLRTRDRAWPQSPQGLGGMLRRVARELRERDLDIKFPDDKARAGHDRDRKLTLTLVGSAS